MEECEKKDEQERGSKMSMPPKFKGYDCTVLQHLLLYTEVKHIYLSNQDWKLFLFLGMQGNVVFLVHNKHCNVYV